MEAGRYEITLESIPQCYTKRLHPLTVRTDCDAISKQRKI
jgi:hypothetical protein